jgi:hypothetical protein
MDDNLPFSYCSSFLGGPYYIAFVYTGCIDNKENFEIKTPVLS